MEKAKIEFTEQEANGLLSLLDIACKTGGLPVANSCLHFSNKLQLAFAHLSEAKKEEELAHEMD